MYALENETFAKKKKKLQLDTQTSTGKIIKFRNAKEPFESNHLIHQHFHKFFI